MRCADQIVGEGAILRKKLCTGHQDELVAHLVFGKKTIPQVNVAGVHPQCVAAATSAQHESIPDCMAADIPEYRRTVGWLIIVVDVDGLVAIDHVAAASQR